MTTVHDLETPFLAVDLDRLEANIVRMREAILGRGVRWRPHVKAIRSPAIARRLLEAGATGITCATIGEAEAMAGGGIGDILIANQVVPRGAIERLATLNATASVAASVDDAANAAELAEAATSTGVTIPVVIEVDIGIGRAGVVPGRPVVELARALSARPGLRLQGVMGWEGHATAIPDHAAKQTAVADAVRQLVDSAAAARAVGIPMPVVSCGGTGTYWMTAACPGVTEIQAGGGIFCDIRYRTEFGVRHDYALTVTATVTSRPTARRIVVDAGWKSMAAYPTLPQPLEVGPVERLRLSAEHTAIDLAEPATRPATGDHLSFVVGYSDSTVFLHDAVYAIRGNTVEAVWPLPPRHPGRRSAESITNVGRGADHE